jgi:hypothetical protein
MPVAYPAPFSIFAMEGSWALVGRPADWLLRPPVLKAYLPVVIRHRVGPHNGAL